LHKKQSSGILKAVEVEKKVMFNSRISVQSHSKSSSRIGSTACTLQKRPSECICFGELPKSRAFQQSSDTLKAVEVEKKVMFNSRISVQSHSKSSSRIGNTACTLQKRPSECICFGELQSVSPLFPVCVRELSCEAL